MVSSVTTRRDVQPFPPHISHGAVYQAGELRELLLTKLVNAEQSCYSSSVFLSLEQRTRLAMLCHVSSELISETNRFLKQRKSTCSSTDEQSSIGKDKKLLSNMKNLIGKRSKSKFSLISNKSSVSKLEKNMLGAPAMSLSRGAFFFFFLLMFIINQFMNNIPIIKKMK